MYNKEKLHDVITNEKYKTIDDNGKIFPPSHNIYRIISETLTNSGSHISSKHIYTILKNDRNDMYCAALKAFGIDKRATYHNDLKDNTFNATNLSNTSTSESVKSFKVIISDEK